MSRQIEIEGELHGESAAGSLKVTAGNGEVVVHFSDVLALRSAISYHTMRTFLKYRKSSSFLSQDLVLKVKDSEWLSIRSGQLKLKRPITLAALYIGLWRNR